MPSVTNISSDDLNMPSVGLSLKAGDTAEVDMFVAEELRGHPLLHVDFETVPAPEPVSDPAPQAADPEGV